GGGGGVGGDEGLGAVESFVAGQGYFCYVTQHMRWIGSRCGPWSSLTKSSPGWSQVNTYEGCLRGLLLKEPQPAPLHPRAHDERYPPLPPSKYRCYDGK